MAYDLHDKLVIAISSRFLIWKRRTIFLRAIIPISLNIWMILWPKVLLLDLYKICSAINKKFDNKLIEVIILSRNNAATGLRIGRSIEHYELDIERTGWTAGTPVARYLEAFKVDLFLSVYAPDVEEAVNSGVAAATILPHTPVAFTRVRYG